MSGKLQIWIDKTLKLNINKAIKRGDVVIDFFGDKGVVVKIKPGVDDENHGTIHVWQSERYEYGADNCEHYPEFGWQEKLRILDE